MDTEADFMSLNKNQLVSMIINLKNENASLRDISSKLESIEHKMIQIQSELSVSKTVTNLLSERVVSLERKMANQAQYSRRECLEITGIPTTVLQRDLEEKVRFIFTKIDCVIPSERIEDCHRIGSKGTTIVKLSKRKDIKKIFANKKQLKEYDANSLKIPEGSKIYINESLCPEYRELWIKCKLLWKNKHLSSFWTANGVVKIKKQDLGNATNISHISDLVKMFPEVDLNQLK